MILKSSHEDIKLINGIASGDTVLIQKVYGKYFDSIVNYTLKNSGTVDDAKDIFQDAIMVIYQKLTDPEFKIQYSLHTYLFTICRNIWLKKLRKKSDQTVSLPPNMVLINKDTFEDELSWREKEKLYRIKFKQLGEKCQKVIRLYLGGTSMQDIAIKMGFSSPGYAKKKKYQCKNQLFKLIQNDPMYSTLTDI